MRLSNKINSGGSNGGGGNGNGGSTPPTDPYPPETNPGNTGNPSSVNIFRNNLTNTCFSNVLENLIQQNFKDKISDIISGLSNSTKININFVDALHTTTGAPGNTNQIKYDSETQVFTATITLSIDKLGSATKEYAAAVIVHEIIHAYFSANQNASEVLDSHDVMATYYVVPMAHYLVQLYGMSLKDATAIIWTGVGDTDSYKKSPTFNYSTGIMTKEELEGIYASYVAGIKGTPICN